jgi:hypothetical protein
MNLDVQRLNGLRMRECASNLSMSIHFGRQRLLDFSATLAINIMGSHNFQQLRGKKPFFFFFGRDLLTAVKLYLVNYEAIDRRRNKNSIRETRQIVSYHFMTIYYSLSSIDPFLP